MTAKVNIGNGNLFLTGSDLSVPGVVNDSPLGRVYNSLAVVAGSSRSAASFGRGWHSTLTDLRLKTYGDGTVTFYDGDGQAADFTPASTGGYTIPAGVRATLTKNSDGTYRIRRFDNDDKLDFTSGGTLTKITDRNSNVLTVTAATSTSPARIVGSRGSSGAKTFTADYANGRITRLTQNPDGSGGPARSYQYDYTGESLTKVTNPHSQETSFGYDSTHNLTSIQVNGVRTLIGYDGQSRVTSLTTPAQGDSDNDGRDDGPTTTYDYTTTAGHTLVKDPNANRSSQPAAANTDYTTDNSDRITEVKDAKGNKRSTSYTPQSNVATSTNAKGGKTTNGYDSSGHNQMSSSRTDRTGAAGASSTANYGTTESTKYSPTDITSPSGDMTTFGYNQFGNQTSTMASDAAKADVDYNDDGTVKTATDPGNQDDPNTTTTNEHNPTRFSYNAHKEREKITPPTGNSLGVRSFSYDHFSRLRTSTSGRGVVTTYHYDELDRLVRQSFSDNTPEVSFSYDAAGNQRERTDSTGTTRSVYDGGNRLTERTFDDGNPATDDSRHSSRYGYDHSGNMTSFTDERGTTSYRYNKLNQLDLVDYADGARSLFNYNEDGKRIDTWHHVSGTNAEGKYGTDGQHLQAPAGFAAHINATLDDDNRVTSLKTTRASSDDTVAAHITYDYKNPSGKDTNRRESETNQQTRKKTTYSYKAGRLDTATGGGTNYDYDYDKRGNITGGIPGANGGELTYNSANQITNAGYSYDGAGNLTNSPDFNAGSGDGLTYNGSDQTTSITPAGQPRVDFGYAGTDQTERTRAADANGNGHTYTTGALGLQSQTPTGVAGSDITALTTSANFDRDPDGGLLSLELVTSSTDTLSGAPVTSRQRLYYYFDALGSVLGLIDTAGENRASYGYDPYGNQLDGKDGKDGDLVDANPYRYAGYYLDTKTNLYKVGLRYYQPRLGRWTQQDILENYGNPAQGNRYAYAGDDPINATDPSGASPEGAAIGAGIGGTLAAYLGGALVAAGCVGTFGLSCVAAAVVTAGLYGGAGAAVGAKLGGGTDEDARLAGLGGIAGGLTSGLIFAFGKYAAATASAT